jgi:hypothetical protein
VVPRPRGRPRADRAAAARLRRRPAAQRARRPHAGRVSPRLRPSHPFTRPIAACPQPGGKVTTATRGGRAAGRRRLPACWRRGSDGC